MYRWIMGGKAKSRISTAEAEALLAKGWVLKEHKSRFYGHSYYIHDEAHRGLSPYINKAVFDTLVKKGHTVKQYVPPSREWRAGLQTRMEQAKNGDTTSENN